MKTLHKLREALFYLYRRKEKPNIFQNVSYTIDVLKGSDFEIGEYTYGTPLVHKHPRVRSRLKIGKFCSIAREVTISFGRDHRTDFISTYPFLFFTDHWPKAKCLKPEDVSAPLKGDVIIGNDVWIGYGAMILAGVCIGDGAVIGAGSVVTGNIEPYSIVAGNPAKLIRKRFDDETIHRLLQIKWWDWPIEKINENVDVICSNNISKIFQLG